MCIAHHAIVTSALPQPVRKSSECIQFYGSRTAKNAINFITAENSTKARMVVNCIVDGADKVAKYIAARIVRMSSARNAFSEIYRIKRCMKSKITISGNVSRVHQR